LGWEFFFTFKVVGFIDDSFLLHSFCLLALGVVLSTEADQVRMLGVAIYFSFCGGGEVVYTFIQMCIQCLGYF
jgi:hypothetical protein